jgi:glycosyltransferase involved in cell wall biosynthesis
MKKTVSVVILANNEEKNLGQCLRSVSGWAHEVVVVDSGSTDRTMDIAREYGARVLKHDFINQADQFNWALENAALSGDWVLRLDADEYPTEELKAEIDRTLPETPQDVTGFSLKRRNYFMGKWIRYGGYYPAWILRLFRRGVGRSDDREMDERIVLVSGRAERMQNDFIDDNHNGLSAWMEKHVRYASREAKAYLTSRSGEPGRRMFYYRFPPFIRALLYFVYRYIVRLGFLDGVRGLIFHFLQGLWYRFLVDVRIFELTRSGKKEI